MSTVQVVDTFERILKRVEARVAAYTDEGRVYRMTMLVGWGHALGRYGVGDFSRQFRRDLSSNHGDAACDVMDEVFNELKVTTIDELLQLCK
jgi:hypothetical protein